MKLLATRKSDQNLAALDPWTVVHLGAGLTCGLLGVGFVPSIAAAGIYELVEQIAERERFGHRLFQASGPESALNVGLDLAVFAAGWWMAHRYNRS